MTARATVTPPRMGLTAARCGSGSTSPANGSWLTSRTGSSPTYRSSPVAPSPCRATSEDRAQLGPVNDAARRYIDPRDWGLYRVPLHPQRGTNTFGRTGFFLHGGKRPGSAGCVDLGPLDRVLFPVLQKLPEPVDVIVPE